MTAPSVLTVNPVWVDPTWTTMIDFSVRHVDAAGLYVKNLSVDQVLTLRLLTRMLPQDDFAPSDILLPEVAAGDAKTIQFDARAIMECRLEGIYSGAGEDALVRALGGALL